LRAVVGLGVGGEWGTGAALVSETWPDKYRARVLGFVQSGFAMGVLLGSLIGAFILPRYGWRMVFFIGFLPALLTFWIRSGIEETDQYRRLKQAQQVAKIEEQGFFAKFRELWTRPYRMSTIGLMCYMSFYIFAWWAVLSWLPGYLGSPVEKGGKGLSIATSGLWMAEMQIGAALGYISFGYIADYIGRKKATVCFLLTAAVMVPIFIFIKQPGWLLVVGPILAFAGYGSAAGQGTISAELYPTRIRGTGQGFMYGCGRFASGFAPYTIGAVALSSGLGTALKTIVPPALVIAAISVVFLIRETRGVKIENIQ
jgi:MFS family permease